MFCFGPTTIQLTDALSRRIDCLTVALVCVSVAFVAFAAWTSIRINSIRKEMRNV